MPSATATALAVGAEAEYWDGLMAGELRLQRCARCAAWHWPAVFRCKDCGSWDHVWEPVDLAGSVYSWTRSWHPFGGLEALEKPFVIAVVQLKGGGGARLVGIMDDPGEVRIGQSVTGRTTTTIHAGEPVPAIRWSA
jgi:uncharacterized OB-fold protein